MCIRCIFTAAMCGKHAHSNEFEVKAIWGIISRKMQTRDDGEDGVNVERGWNERVWMWEGEKTTESKWDVKDAYNLSETTHWLFTTDSQPSIIRKAYQEKDCMKIRTLSYDLEEASFHLNNLFLPQFIYVYWTGAQGLISCEWQLISAHVK